MGVKFPIVAGTLTDVTANFRQRFAAQARNVEDSQSWSVTTNNGLPEGVIALQNLTIAPLKGVVLEVQAEERPCANKGKVFYMSLDFNASVASGSVVGVTFAFPSMISSGNRCIDIVDVIPG